MNMSTFDKLKTHLDEGVVGFPTALAVRWGSSSRVLSS
jgi:hypothetical protein